MGKFDAKLLEETTTISDVIPREVYQKAERERQKFYKKFLDERFAEFEKLLAKMERESCEPQNLTQNDEDERV